MLTFQTHIIRSNRKTVAMQIDTHGMVVIKAPLRFPPKNIQRFIQQNKDWIQKRLVKIQQHPQTKREYKHGETFLYLGKEHIIEVGEHKSISVKDEKILFPHFLAFRMQKEMESWYIQQAKNLISTQLEYYAKQMNLSYTSVTFSDTKSSWGSCSHDNALQFNWRLIMTPLLVINYVIIHELTHTIEKNHSFFFWTKVRSVNPSYKQQIKWLKTHGNTLVV